MIIIDGSFGEGGGQIVRSSLAMSLVTGKPVTIENIRANRKKPGLRRQHLTALGAAREVGAAEVEGERLASRRLVFRPKGLFPGEYHFRVGTAGSATLVFQTVLPALLTAKGPSTVKLEGGTHNPLAPPFDFLAKSYLPLVAKLGANVEGELETYGFFPAGGGQCRFEITPGPLGRLELMKRGKIRAKRVRSIVSKIPEHVAERECKTIRRLSGWKDAEYRPEVVHNSPGPGNICLIEIETERITAVFSEPGERGVRAEQVAKRALAAAERWLDQDVPVCEHLADQLLLPLALAAHHRTGGGRFLTGPLSLHAETHLELIERFLDVAVSVEKSENGNVAVGVEERVSNEQ